MTIVLAVLAAAGPAFALITALVEAYSRRHTRQPPMTTPLLRMDDSAAIRPYDLVRWETRFWTILFAAAGFAFIGPRLLLDGLPQSFKETVPIKGTDYFVVVTGQFAASTKLIVFGCLALGEVVFLTLRGVWILHFKRTKPWAKCDARQLGGTLRDVSSNCQGALMVMGTRLVTVRVTPSDAFFHSLRGYRRFAPFFRADERLRVRISEDHPGVYWVAATSETIKPGRASANALNLRRFFDLMSE